MVYRIKKVLDEPKRDGACNPVTHVLKSVALFKLSVLGCKPRPASFFETIRVTMITSLYASFSALLIVRLSISVIKLRRKNRIRVGDGGNEELQLAIRTHANAVEYIRSVTGFATPSLTFYKLLSRSNVPVGVANPDQLQSFK
jgi:hypothetical protein